MSKKFLQKQAAGLRVVSAKWTHPKDKPDHPSFWNVMQVTMDDGSKYRLKDDFVKENKIKWVGE